MVGVAAVSPKSPLKCTLMSYSHTTMVNNKKHNLNNKSYNKN